MPELPEVETVARTLRPQVQECLIEGAEVLRSGSLHPLSLPLATLVGRRIADVGRRGTLLLVTHDSRFAEEVGVTKTLEL